MSDLSELLCKQENYLKTGGKQDIKQFDGANTGKKNSKKIISKYFLKVLTMVISAC